LGDVVTERLRGRAAVEQRKRRLAKEPLCRHCLALGKITQAVVADHILALTNGGTDDDDNIQCLCHPCHERKTRKDLGQRERNQIDRSGRPTNLDHPWNR